MSEPGERPYRRRTDPGLRIQRLLGKSDSPEEILFKINELLYQAGEGNTRKNVRAPISIQVNYRVGRQDFSGLSYTLSRGGVFIKTARPLPESTVVELTLLLPGEEKAIPVEGEVINRISPDQAREKSGISGMAIRFLRIRSMDQHRIDRFVRSRARQIFRP